MQYGKAFTFAFRKPKSGWKNVLLGGLVVMFIPVVGSIVFLGYRGYVASDLDEDPDLRYHRDFKFDKFGDYLSKGVWQFLAQMLIGCVAMLGYVIMFAGFLTVGQQSPDKMLLVLFAGYGITFLLVVIGTFFVWPLELYAALSEDVSVGRAFAFAGRFAGLMWGEMLVAVFVYFILAAVTMLIGQLACCVGMIPAVAIMSQAEIHIIVQLYRSYLEKGGRAIRDLDAIHDVTDAD
jgi:hypothetical protein